MDIQDKIDRYLRDEMSPCEKADFEKEMSSDALLAKEVAEQQLIVEAVRKVGDQRSIGLLKSLSEEELKDILSHKNDAQPARPHSIIRWMVYGTMAAAAVFALFFLADVFKPEEQGQQLYAAYFEAAPNEYATVSRGIPEMNRFDEPTQKIIIDAFGLYDQKEYKKALQRFLEATKNIVPGDSPELFFYISICQLETGRIKDAIGNLEKLNILDNSYPYHQDVDWYLALAYLKNEQIDKATDILTNIVQDNGYYEDYAKKILKKLGN